MDRDECIKLLKAHRSSTVKPTQKVKEAIDFALQELAQPQNNNAIKVLQNRCFVMTGGTTCIFCTLDCEHK